MVSPSIMTQPAHMALAKLRPDWLGRCLSCTERATHVGLVNGTASTDLCANCSSLWLHYPVDWHHKAQKHIAQERDT